MTTVDASVSVVIPCHREDRWPWLVRAVDSVSAQVPAPARVVVVVDHNPALHARATRELAGVTVLENRFERGVSGTRNTGAQYTRTPLIAMLDDDVYAHPGWLRGLAAPFADPAVVGTGGAIRPAWEGRRPRWFPDEFLWAVGGSYAGMPTGTARVRNVWSASMMVRRDVFQAVGGFRLGFGKVGDRARPEDTDLCVRMSRHSGGAWVYVPESVIDHPVPAVRGTFGFFLARCYTEGRGKIEMSRLLDGAGPALDAERDYLRRTLPRAVVRGFAETVRGRGLAPAGRSTAVLAGVAAAAVGGAVESLRRRPAPARPTLAAATGVDR